MVAGMDVPVSDPRALALWAAGQKLSVIAGVSDSRVQNVPVLAAIAEACWWLASLDEDLQNTFRESYTSARETDPGGALLKGIRWARHRHTHDLIATTGGDVRPFFYDEPEALLYISDPYRWRSVESMNLQGKSATAMPDQRERYIGALEGTPVLPSLEAALQWLTQSVETFSQPR